MRYNTNELEKIAQTNKQPLPKTRLLTQNMMKQSLVASISPDSIWLAKQIQTIIARFLVIS